MTRLSCRYAKFLSSWLAISGAFERISRKCVTQQPMAFWALSVDLHTKVGSGTGIRTLNRTAGCR